MTLKRTPYKPRVSLRPDRKNTQVTLEEWTEAGGSPDDYGQPTGSWGEVTNPDVWAEVKPVSGRIAEYARQLYAEATHRVMIDYRSDVTRHGRVKLGSRYLYIGHIRNLDEADITLELLCKEGDPYGS